MMVMDLIVIARFRTFVFPRLLRTSETAEKLALNGIIENVSLITRTIIYTPVQTRALPVCGANTTTIEVQTIICVCIAIEEQKEETSRAG
jgi:methyl coenzyme M reductase subunit D